MSPSIFYSILYSAASGFHDKAISAYAGKTRFPQVLIHGPKLSNIWKNHPHLQYIVLLYLFVILVMKYRCSSSLASNYLGHVTFCQAEKVCMFSMFMTFEHIENEVIQAKSTHLFVLLKLHTKSPHSVGVPHTPEPLLSSHCRYVYPSR